jgi:uncharacterized protein YndB with AHSA1/START domain/predicted SnoaL-like aldol condensation-catalyzing enzyme
MTTRTIVQEVTFSASPKEVFEVLMDPVKHSRATGAPAEIDRSAGGRFVQNGGGHWGTTLEFKEPERIVQSWHARNWPLDVYSEVTFTLWPLADGRRTQLSLVQAGVPEDHFEEVNTGWQKFYWKRLAAFFRDEKVAVVRRFVEEVQNGRNLESADELVTPDCVIHLPGMLLPIGPAGPKAAARAFLSSFSEITITAEDIIVEGDRVAERLCACAVHTGEFSGVPATGRAVSWTMNQIFRIENGKIAEAWPEISSAELMAQIIAKEVKAA